MKRFAVLDAFRGLFALVIVFFHTKDYNGITDNAFVNNGDLFVSFFFVLSGFVIAFVYYNRIKNRPTLFEFIKNRFFRLYPLHLYTLLVFAAFELTRIYLYNHGYFTHPEPSNNNLSTFLSNVFLLNATPVGGGLSWNYPSWSISAEFITYLIFGLLMFLLRKNRLVKMIIIALVPVAVIMLSYFISSLIFEAVTGFFLGVIVYKLYNRYRTLEKLSKVSGSIIEVVIFTLTIIMVCNKPAFLNCLYVYSFLFALNIYLFAFEKGILSSLLKKDCFQVLGKYSYSIYLNHAIVIEVVNFVLVRFLKLQGAVLYIVPFIIAAITIAYSALTYKYIEARFYKKRLHNKTF